MTTGDGGLTQGAVERIVAGEASSDGFRPTLQCIGACDSLPLPPRPNPNNIDII